MLEWTKFGMRGAFVFVFFAKYSLAAYANCLAADPIRQLPSAIVRTRKRFEEVWAYGKPNRNLSPITKTSA